MTVDALTPAPAAGVLTDEALAFLGALHERFEPRRRELLAARAERRRRIAAGETLDLLPETREIREATGASPPRRPTCRTAASRSRVRSTARWSSTR